MKNYYLLFYCIIAIVFTSCNSESSDSSNMPIDADGDGYFLVSSTTPQNAADCDDTNANINPGATEIPDNGIDENCDGLDNKVWYEDADSDGFGNPNVTQESNTLPSGFVKDNTDCDDNDATTFPDNIEICDGKDNNCDGEIDEGVLSVFYADSDVDNFGDASNTIEACTAPDGYISDNTDCDDSDALTNPGATEICGDGIDNNCDGQIDENCPVTEFTDSRDGRTYQIKDIGTQTWMAENLDYYTPEDSWYYENDSISYHTLGRLYTWENAKSLAPSGWHLPSEEEFNELINYLGGASVASGSLKEVGTDHWISPNSNATNSSGFTALGGGNVDSAGIRLFNYIYDLGFWWTSTPGSTNNQLGPIPVYFVIPSNNGPTGYYEDRWNTDGLSVRYIKD